MIEGPFKLSPTEGELDTVISGFSENRAAAITAPWRALANRKTAYNLKCLRMVSIIVRSTSASWDLSSACITAYPDRTGLWKSGRPSEHNPTKLTLRLKTL